MPSRRRWLAHRPDIACIFTSRRVYVFEPLVNGLITRNYATAEQRRCFFPFFFFNQPLVPRIPTELHNNIQAMGVETLKRPIQISGIVGQQFETMEPVVALLRIAFHATILDYPRGAITLGKVQPVLTSTRVNRNPLLYNYTSILEKNYLLCAMPRILSYPNLTWARHQRSSNRCSVPDLCNLCLLFENPNKPIEKT